MTYLRSFTPAGQDTAATAVVFPQAGAGCLRLHAIASAAPRGIALLGVQLPGREDRLADPAPGSLAEAVAGVAREIRELRDRAPHRPLALLGLSLGGTLAYEVARGLEAAGAAADSLMVVAARAPEFWRVFPAADPPAAELAALLPPGQDPALARYAAATLRADLRLMDGYRVPEEPLARTWLRTVSGRRDVVVTAAQMAGWRDRAADYRGHRETGAGHHQLLDPDVVRGLLADVAAEAAPPQAVGG